MALTTSILKHFKIDVCQKNGDNIPTCCGKKLLKIQIGVPETSKK